MSSRPGTELPPSAKGKRPRQGTHPRTWSCLWPPTGCGAGWSDDTRLVTPTTMPWGEPYTGAALIDMYILKLAAHAWDLARALDSWIDSPPTLPRRH